MNETLCETSHKLYEDFVKSTSNLIKCSLNPTNEIDNCTMPVTELIAEISHHSQKLNSFFSSYALDLAKDPKSEHAVALQNMQLKDDINFKYFALNKLKSEIENIKQMINSLSRDND
ncbi:hypothetical protein A3Q56_04362 [Intoshia linei]|uniref:Uncharacterized protein n=1 Tax=Intoshia linei TaxID=1819745 RepID=A0A177B134_9BILA|nr:hypothetical protein A3Q56_04362 [Intoshia linei]